jgi:hypothetical protein
VNIDKIILFGLKAQDLRYRFGLLLVNMFDRQRFDHPVLGIMDKTFTINISGSKEMNQDSVLEFGFVCSLQRAHADLRERYPGLDWISFDFTTIDSVNGLNKPGWLSKGDTWQRSFRAKVKSLSNQTSREICGVLVCSPELGKLGRWKLDHVLIH